MANVKKAFTGEVRDLVDPYIDVHFAGQRVSRVFHFCIFFEFFSWDFSFYAEIPYHLSWIIFNFTGKQCFLTFLGSGPEMTSCEFCDTIDFEFQAKTSVKKHTYEPEWNEQITFAELVRHVHWYSKYDVISIYTLFLLLAMFFFGPGSNVA